MTAYDPIERLTKDLRTAAKTLSDAEARFLVDAYYQMQDARIRNEGQVRSMAEEPHDVLVWFSTQSRTLENQVKGALDKYTIAHPVGDWLRSVKGIGPVISAGLLAHIDIKQAPTVGHIWNFAGLSPDIKWEKGKKRPWNARLKVLCWKAGESFVKVSGQDDAYYGKVYADRKALEISRNEEGKFADQAKAKLEKFKIGLPPAHIHARATRYAVKLFLSHLHETWYRIEYGEAPPNPYPIAILGHAHKIEPERAIPRNSNIDVERATEREIATLVRSEPAVAIATREMSEPRVRIATKNRSEPSVRIATLPRSEPRSRIATGGWSEPKVRIATKCKSEPWVMTATGGWSEPSCWIATKGWSEPSCVTATLEMSEPWVRIATLGVSEPSGQIATQQLSEPET
jgi:hypothetical protein